jgi:DNA-binding transcriptional LysR family regulator
MDVVAARWFVATVHAGTITGAAEVLGVARPTLSRRLAALEEDLGVALLHRSTRAVRPTRAGRRLVERMEPVLRDLATIEADVASEATSVSGTLVVSIPPPMAPEIAALLVGLQREHPALAVDLRVDVRMADLRGGVEVALRAGPSMDPDLVQRRVTTRPVRALASPDHLARAGIPRDVDDLASHALILERGGDGAVRTSWPLQDGGRLAVRGSWITDDQHGVLQAALAGAGVALMSEVSYGPALAAGRLALVLPERVGTELPLFAVTARRTLLPARVRVFLDAVRDRYADQR